MTPEQWRNIQVDEDHTHTLLDRARYGYYPPGSTLKVATAGAGMEAGLDPEYDCNHTAFNLRWTFGGQVYGRRELSDDVHDRAAHNHIRMSRALRVSCNLYFAYLGLVLGPERLYHAFADPDRWDLSHVRPIAQFAEDLPLNAFGQGTMLASCTEMARIAAAVANRGAMMQPIYWKELREAHGAAVQTNAPTVLSRPLSEANAAKLAEMMRGVVTDGTARGVFDGLPIRIAGKTGTAQTDSGDGEPHSWFIGYAPYDHPQIAFACVIENGGYGKQGAAPAIRDLLQKLYGR
jgi:cell division protein FtsI/penicillin-binding protein 2